MCKAKRFIVKAFQSRISPINRVTHVLASRAVDTHAWFLNKIRYRGTKFRRSKLREVSYEKIQNLPFLRSTSNGWLHDKH